MACSNHLEKLTGLREFWRSADLNLPSLPDAFDEAGSPAGYVPRTQQPVLVPGLLESILRAPHLSTDCVVITSLCKDRSVWLYASIRDERDHSSA